MVGGHQGDIPSEAQTEADTVPCLVGAALGTPGDMATGRAGWECLPQPPGDHAG